MVSSRKILGPERDLNQRRLKQIIFAITMLQPLVLCFCAKCRCSVYNCDVLNVLKW